MFQVGAKELSSRVRTYNFPDDRTTDHRLRQSFTLSRFMMGDDIMHAAIVGLLDMDKQLRLEHAIKEDGGAATADERRKRSTA